MGMVPRPCKGLFLLSRSANGGRRNSPVFPIAQRERQQLKSGAGWGNFKVEPAMLTMGIENRDEVWFTSQPVDPADSYQQERPGSQMASHGGGLRPARAISAPSRLDDRKKPQHFQRNGPPPSSPEPIKSVTGKARSQLAVAAIKRTRRSQRRHLFSFKLMHQLNWLSLIVAGHALSLAQVHFTPGKEACFKVSSWATGGSELTEFGSRHIARLVQQLLQSSI